MSDNAQLPVPDFIKQISNTSVCTWFYVMFILNVILAFFAIMAVVFMSFVLKVNVAYKLLYFVGYFVAIAIPVVNTTFFYVLCDRSLLSYGRY